MNNPWLAPDRQPVDLPDGGKVYPDNGLSGGWNYKNRYGIVCYYPSRQAALAAAGLLETAAAPTWDQVAGPMDRKRARAAGRSGQAAPLLAYDTAQASLF